MVRVRKQVQVLSNQLEDERQSTRKNRDRLTQLTETMSQQADVIEHLKSEITSREGEILAGKQQINKLSMLLSQRKSDMI